MLLLLVPVVVVVVVVVFLVVVVIVILILIVVVGVIVVDVNVIAALVGSCTGVAADPTPHAGGKPEAAIAASTSRRCRGSHDAQRCSVSSRFARNVNRSLTVRSQAGMLTG